jgi:hypothetical protein
MGQPSTIAAIAAAFCFSFSTYFSLRAAAGHFAFVNAYALPLGILCLHKTFDENSRLWALGVGASLVLAVFCQYYYAVYFCAYAVLYVALRYWRAHVSFERRPVLLPAVGFLFALGLVALAVAVWVSISRGGVIRLGTFRISLQSSTNASLVWWISWTIAYFLRTRVRLHVERRLDAALFQRWVWLGVPLLLLIPFALRMGRLFFSGDFGAQSIGWKTGPQGLYPLSLLFPNPNNVFWGRAFQPMLQPWSLLEQASGSLSVVAIVVVLVTGAWRVSKWWSGAAAFFAVMSFGPFLKFFPGFDHGPMLPFWLFRYIPLVSGARMPSRWIVLGLLCWSILLAFGISRLKRPALRWAVVGLMLLELWPMRALNARPDVPLVYTMMGPTSGNLLELPFGVRDGRMSWGYHLPAEKMFYQIQHQQPLVGGYLARIPDSTFEKYGDEECLRWLIDVQNNEPHAAPDSNAFKTWLKAGQITSIVLDKTAASEMLRVSVFDELGPPNYSDDTHVGWQIE